MLEVRCAVPFFYTITVAKQYSPRSFSSVLLVVQRNSTQLCLYCKVTLKKSRALRSTSKTWLKVESCLRESQSQFYSSHKIHNPPSLNVSKIHNYEINHLPCKNCCRTIFQRYYLLKVNNFYNFKNAGNNSFHIKFNGFEYAPNANSINEKLQPGYSIGHKILFLPLRWAWS